MTNKEILQSNLLDILFEHRNKDYGAYALRRNYNYRMHIALGISLSLILLFILINAFGKRNLTAVENTNNKEGVVLKELIIEPDKPKEIPKAVVPKTPAVAQVKNTAIKIVPDNQVHQIIADNRDKLDKQAGITNTEGPSDKKIVLPKTDSTTEQVTQPVVAPVIPEEKFFSSDPEFPGGAKGLEKFLLSNLNTPDQLEAGEKKTVRVRFKVEKDGSVSGFEITGSGGNEFDREVIRVCKRMPRWKPAVQNGSNVTVNYLLPVTFIGIEQ